MQSLDMKIGENYALNVESTLMYRDSLIVDTSEGRKVLKRVPFSAERLNFVHGAKEHLYENGFTTLDRYMCTIDGKPYFNYENSIYTLSDFIDGRESDFDDDTEIRSVSRTLGEIHKASRGYVPPEGCRVRDELGKLPKYFSKRLEDIRKMKKHAQKNMSHFDRILLEWVDLFYEDGKNAIDELAASSYEQLVENTRREGLFCHRDYAHHNIIMNAGEVYVTNFDYCCFELKLYDLANLIRRKMRKCDWDIKKAVLIINEYCFVESLSVEEMTVLKIILQFPQKFWRVANRYYNSRRSWSEKNFIMRLREVTDEVSFHKEFIRSLSKIY